MRFCAVVVCIASLLLGACASTGTPAAGGGNAEIGKLGLFAADGAARFSFYYSCAGSVSQETELCSAPSADFSDWAGERHIPLKRIMKDDADDAGGVSAAKLSSKDATLPYRVYVRFVPIAISSYAWALQSDVKGGYTPARAGYRADIFVYNVAEHKFALHTDLVNRTELKEHGDPTPFVHDGAKAVIAALDSGHRQDAAHGN